MLLVYEYDLCSNARLDPSTASWPAAHSRWTVTSVCRSRLSGPGHWSPGVYWCLWHWLFMLASLEARLPAVTLCYWTVTVFWQPLQCSSQVLVLVASCLVKQGSFFEGTLRHWHMLFSVGYIIIINNYIPSNFDVIGLWVLRFLESYAYGLIVFLFSPVSRFLTDFFCIPNN